MSNDNTDPIPLSPQLAVDQFIKLWSSGYLADDLGTKLTCDEADALADVFLAFGDRGAYDSWIAAHAKGDDCGDRHCTCGCEYLDGDVG